MSKKQQIISEFYKCCNEWADKNGAFSTEEYSSKKGVGCEIYLRLIKVEFVLYTKAQLLVPKNTLVCRIYPRKNSEVHFLLSDLMPHFFPDDFRALYFWNLTQEKMPVAFLALEDILKSLIPKIEECDMQELDDVLRDDLFSDCQRMYSLKSEDFDFEKAQDMQNEEFLNLIGMLLEREKYMIYRFTVKEEYTYFILGDIDKSVKLYKKHKNKDQLFTRYEQNLLDFLETPAAKNFVPIPRELIINGTYENAPVSSKRESKDILLGIAVLLPIFSLFFILLTTVIDLIVFHGSVYSVCVPWYWAIMCAVLPSMFGGIAFRRHIWRLVYKKEAKKLLDLDEMVNSKETDITAKIAFGVSFFLVLLFCVAMSIGTMAVYNDKLTVAEYSPFTHSEYRFEDIEEIYHIDARYNVYGERVPFGSYVLVMKDKTMFDFYSNISEEKTEKKVLPIVLKNHKFEIKNVDSDRNLPYYKEEE